MPTNLTPDEIKERERQATERIWNEGDLSFAEKAFSREYIGHRLGPDGGDMGREGLKGFIGEIRGAFPDLQMTVDLQVVEEDTVAVHFTARGTHQAPFLGYPPTGNRATTHGIWIHRYEGDKVAEAWSAWDTFGLLDRVGALPKPPES